MSHEDLALHTNSHRPQESQAKPSAPPDLIQYEFFTKIQCDFTPGRGSGTPYLSAAVVAAYNKIECAI